MAQQRQEHTKDIKVRESGKSPIRFCYTSYVCWETPLSGWSKLDTDVLVSPNSAYAGGGGFIRDSKGSWVRVFSRAIETSFIVSSFWQNFVLYEMAYLWQNFLGLKSSLSM